MTRAEATIVVPTHNHGGLLGHAVRSALVQTVEEIQVFIVGDGADEETRAIAEGLAKSDRRVRFFDNPKGPRHGELHRHAALKEASGRAVLYLSDDDLFLPDHVERTMEALQDSDFTHSLPVGIDAAGRLRTWVGHLSVETSRSGIMRFENFIPLSCGAHTLDLYRRLPHGWRTTPEGIHTDVYMWAQILDQEDVRVRSSSRVTVLSFPSPWRTGMTLEDRVSEMSRWVGRLTQEGFKLDITDMALEEVVRQRAEMSANLGAQIQWGHDALAKSELAREALESRVAELDALLVDTGAKLELEEQTTSSLQERAASLEDAMLDLESRIKWITSTKTWRFRNRILSVPGVAPAVRWVGRARSP